MQEPRISVLGKALVTKIGRTKAPQNAMSQTLCIIHEQLQQCKMKEDRYTNFVKDSFRASLKMKHETVFLKSAATRSIKTLLSISLLVEVPLPTPYFFDINKVRGSYM